ncbi:CHRD domain-containing protein [Streptomonospora wellingtoniae]|uniref:CHRD domain-containing protein n=1 Tax=Streptomonospora wellingtoniae TaxID=3075544 RepID=A0ABU2KP49_9ACTN|nr:CHRD domain-containing protein [Streptomonospora sp. DSM 45055]MDT0300923.1 CHRD domain-containing protein [Streptomonospora sp. DSM 45055]
MNARKLAPLAIALPLGLSTCLFAAAPASAAETWTFQSNLAQLNDSGTSGQAWVEVEGNTADITVNVSGAVPDSPHAQHIHIGGQGVCPTMDADDNDDGIVSTPEGQGSYGGVKVSLTTEGDTGADSAVAVDRMPAGDGYTYERTVDLSDDVIQDISDGSASVVVHGIDANGDGEYSGDAKSPLDEELPLEATAPAACGELQLSPQGGMDTGAGGTAGGGMNMNAGLIGLGGVLAATAVGGAVAARRLRHDS